MQPCNLSALWSNTTFRLFLSFTDHSFRRLSPSPSSIPSAPRNIPFPRPVGVYVGEVGHWLSVPVLPGVNPFLLKRSSHMGTTVAGILDAPPRQAGPFSYRSVVSVPTASANAAAWNENTTKSLVSVTIVPSMERKRRTRNENTTRAHWATLQL